MMALLVSSAPPGALGFSDLPSVGLMMRSSLAVHDVKLGGAETSFAVA